MVEVRVKVENVLGFSSGVGKGEIEGSIEKSGQCDD